MTNPNKRCMGFYGLGESYFNESRQLRLQQFVSLVQSSKTSTSEVKMKRFHRRVCDYYSSYIAGSRGKDIVIDAYEEYMKDEDMMRFEQSSLLCVYHLSLSQYQDVLDSDNPSVRFLYSTLEYKVVGGMLEYTIFEEKYLVNPKGTNILITMIPAEKQVQLNLLGIVSPGIPYMIREVQNDGQMKIFTDIFKMLQGGDRHNKKVLVVGSSSQATGGSKSYDVLQFMLVNSRIDLYDPHDSNEYYQGANGNLYTRHAKAFQYGPEIVAYDYVQDDAFVEYGKNRMKLDPDKFLFRAQRFSCKKLDGDEEYFREMRGSSQSPSMCCLGCANGSACFKTRFDFMASEGYKQVGKVATSETRVMSHVPVMGHVRDTRFGTCVFCREMFFYCNHQYSNEFFKALASIHSIGSRCAIKKRYEVPIADGNIDYKGRKMHVVVEIDNPVCLAYDQVLGLPVTTNFLPYSKRTYVFSSIDNIMSYMYAGRVAVYDPGIGKYYVNYLDEFIYQEDFYDEIFNGVRFRQVEKFDRGKKISKLFSGNVDGIPIVTSEMLGHRSFSLMLDLARYYGSFYLEYGGKKYVLV